MNLDEWLGKDNQIGKDIWHNKYQYNNETLDEWFKRVSGGNEDVERLIKEKKFLFGGRILANRGVENDGKKISLSNCYVIEPPEDNIESIFDTACKLARTYSYGGGCGVDIGNLSPRGAKINNAANQTSGAVSFMDLYSMTTSLIGQEGRRGALMISIPCDHPDLEEFIDVKNDLNRVTKANISIRVTDEFMNAVFYDKDYTMSFTRQETGEVIEKTVKAKELFYKICKNNWNTGEPGLLFWDKIETWNMLEADPEFHYGGVNPCAEESLPAGGSCLLGSLNLSEFVTNEFNDPKFDFNAFCEAVRIATIGLNQVLNEGLPLHPLPEQRESVRKWRQIGLGIFGLADMLIKMKIPYGSKESICLCDAVAKYMLENAIDESQELGVNHGNYPAFNKKLINKSQFVDKCYGKEINHLRNSQLLTIAPTGTLSTMIGVSGGIEPIFASSYTRKTESLKGHDEYYKVYTPIVKRYMEKYAITDECGLPQFFVTAKDIDSADRIKMQATWQKYIDASISSTINLPNEATVEDIEDIYIYAWTNGLKGITVFRDGCKRAGILTTESSKEKTSTSSENDCSYDKNDGENDINIPRGMIIKADDNCIGFKRTLHTGCGTLHCEAFFDPDTGELIETYLSKGSTGGCNNFMIGLSRMISLSARGGVDIYSIVDQLNSCGTCPSYAVRRATHGDTSKGSCCPVAIGNALLDMYENLHKELFDDESEPVDDIEETEEIKEENIEESQQHNKHTSLKCPQCGADLIAEGGCNICKSCGWSKCD